MVGDPCKRVTIHRLRTILVYDKLTKTITDPQPYIKPGVTHWRNGKQEDQKLKVTLAV